MLDINKTSNPDRGIAINHHIKQTTTIKNMLRAGLGIAVLSILTACGSSSSSTPSASVGAVSCTDIAGEPDIMGQITYTQATATAGDTVTMHIPVDADTVFVGAELAGIGSGGIPNGGHSEPTLASGTGYVTIASPGVAQTVDVPMTIATGSGAGSYVPVINLCTADLGSCTKIGGSPGVAVNYAFSSLAAPLFRFKYFASGSVISPSATNLPVNSCVDTYTLTVI